MQTYYELLDIPVHAAKPEIRRAYIEKCKTFHPDLHEGAEWAQERLQHINEAYHTLSDAFLRQQYDATLLNLNPSSETIDSPIVVEPSIATKPSKPAPSSIKGKHIIRLLGGTLAVLLWSAVLIVRNVSTTPDPTTLERQAIAEEQARFQAFCERHPKLIKKSEYFLVMNATPPIGFTFALERLLATGDTTSLRQKIADLKATL
jgi:curved DNA-binding protein CbpA